MFVPLTPYLSSLLQSRGRGNGYPEDIESVTGPSLTTVPLELPEDGDVDGSKGMRGDMGERTKRGRDTSKRVMLRYLGLQGTLWDLRIRHQSRSLEMGYYYPRCRSGDIYFSGHRRGSQEGDSPISSEPEYLTLTVHEKRPQTS